MVAGLPRRLSADLRGRGEGLWKSFENKNALPFGYVYDTAYDGKKLYWTPAKDRLRLLANGYYMTQNEAHDGQHADDQECLRCVERGGRNGGGRTGK